MKSAKADSIKTMATRAMLTCTCTHDQLSHVRVPYAQGSPFCRYEDCLIPGCLCKHFSSSLSGQEKRAIDEIMDEKIRVGQLAAILKHQAEQLPKQTTIPVLKYQPATGKQASAARVTGNKQERTTSARSAPVASIYKDIPIKKPKEKYSWQE